VFETYAVCVGHAGIYGFCYLLQFFFFSKGSGFPKVRIDSSDQITFFLGILLVVNFFDTMFAQKFVALWSLGTAV